MRVRTSDYWFLEQERGFGKQSTPIRQQKDEELKSPVLSNHQGELTIAPTMFEESKAEVVEPVAFKDVAQHVQENSKLAKFEAKKLLSQASQKELLVPTQKDMKIREYLEQYKNKTEVGVKPYICFNLNTE